MSQIEAGHFEAETAYASVDRHRIADNKPYIYRTHDGGKTWRNVVAGIPEGERIRIAEFRRPRPPWFQRLAGTALSEAWERTLGLPDSASGSTWEVIRTGITINLLNPKLTIFFFAFLPQFVRADDPDRLTRMLALSAVFMALTFVVFAAYGVFAASVRTRSG